MKMRATTESRDEETRCSIVAAAENLFHQFGYQKTTVADIAKKLGMSSANVYRFFESKKQINESVALRLMGEVEQACEAIAGGGGDAASRVRKLIATVHEMNNERYIADVRMHEMVAAAMRDSWPIINQHIEKLDVIMAGVIKDGVAAKEFEVADPVLAARCVHVAIMRFSNPSLMIECRGMEVPSLEQMTDFVLRGLGCRE